MDFKYFFFGLLFCCSINCKMEKITYFSIERPKVHWYDTNVIKNFTVLCRRLSRQDPRHYLDLYIHTLIPLTNDYKLDYYFYQFLTNRYRPSFVEMHFSLCDMWHFDPIFGQALRNAAEGRTCPIPPGEFNLKNVSLPFVPKGFPFTKGRIYCNASLIEGGVTKHVGRASIDMEIKVARFNQN